MNDAALKAVLLPLIVGPYDYRVADDLPRGTLVVAPLGPRESLGAVWGPGEGGVAEAKLKEAVALDGRPDRKSVV